MLCSGLFAWYLTKAHKLKTHFVLLLEIEELDDNAQPNFPMLLHNTFPCCTPGVSTSITR